ncbi:MAG: DUF488 domain-containing protein [Candidatus Kryptoniota bacterium]
MQVRALSRAQSVMKLHMRNSNIMLKRVYEKPKKDDGYRILVDRLWPRGLSRASARVDLWLKDIAPSTELRRWFNHDPDKWDEFKLRYRKELDGNKETVNRLMEIIRKKKNVTFLYSTTNRVQNNASALIELLGL